DPEKIRRIIDQLVDGLSPLFSTIRVEGPAKTSVDKDADLIFVESQLWPLEFHADNIRAPLQRSESASDALSMDDFVHQLDRAVVLGDPGGGKTTLVRMLCRRLLPKARIALAPLPIFVTLRKFYSARLKEPSLSLLEYILRELA